MSISDAFRLSPSYPGDREMELLLAQAGAKLSLSAVYGLFYGCLAAPRPVPPALYMPVIFGPAEAGDRSVREGLSGLLHRLSRWRPATAPFILPDPHYPDQRPDDRAGLLARAGNDAALIEYFMEGIALGGTRDEDLSEDSKEALHILGRMRAHLEDYREALGRGDEEAGLTVKETKELLGYVEAALADAIACITLGLTGARAQLPPEVNALFDRHGAAGWRGFCTCGSGRSYGRCCGRTH